MDKINKSYLLKFEVLSESKSGNLVNGFSGAISMGGMLGGKGPVLNICPTNTNCAGANCTAGCGPKADAVIICDLKGF